MTLEPSLRWVRGRDADKRRWRGLSRQSGQSLTTARADTTVAQERQLAAVRPQLSGSGTGECLVAQVVTNDEKRSSGKPGDCGAKPADWAAAPRAVRVPSGSSGEEQSYVAHEERAMTKKEAVRSEGFWYTNCASRGRRPPRGIESASEKRARS